MTIQRLFSRLGISAAALLLALSATSVSAQTMTGTIAGQVTDGQGGALPGVVVTLSSRFGQANQTTDALGSFRFLGLNTGTYEVRTMLNGFKPRIQSNLDITIGKTVDLKLTLELGGVTEAITVVGSTTKVDTTTTATDTTISQDLLFNMPISRANPAVSMLNYAPGINSSSAFGGASGSANSLMVDGVDVRDPEAGTAWVFFNYNIIDQVHIGSLGQSAEYGGFTGAVINTVTKSGGNRFTGLFEQRYTGKKFRGNNVSAAVTKVNPSIKATGVDSLKDYTVQLGGPLRQNKAFFFASVQRYAIKQDPDGPRTLRTEVSPRFNGKLTLQPTVSDNLVASFQYDQYNQGGRTGLGGVNGTTDARVVQQDSPEWTWNGQYRRVLGNSGLFEVKLLGYWGYFDLDPLTPTSARLDGDSGAYSGGAGYSAQYDRTRNQLNASLAKYVEAKGTHAFKFGVEIERSNIRNRFAYTDGLFFYDYGGAPYLAYAYQYDVKGRNDRMSFFAQDQWQLGRLTANIGARMDRIKGVGTSDNKTYYDVAPIAPRLGLAFDVGGDGKSVLRAYYGQLYDGAVFASWSNALPGIGDYIIYEATGTIANTKVKEIDRISGASKYTVLKDLDHPRTDEISVAFERELGRGLKATATYIRRDAKNFINATVVGAQWTSANYTNPLNGKVETIYRWANRTSDQRFQIGNVDNFAYSGAPTANAYREYNGGMFVLTRAYSNRWQAQISYVYSETNGTVTNSATSGISSGQFQTPNTVHVNTDGLVGFDRTHEFKAFAGYQIPVIEVSANVYYIVLSGVPWTPFQRVSASTFNWTGSIDLLLEPRGNRRLEKQQLLDLRLEKVFNVGANRFGLYVDAENLLNTGFQTGVQARNPSASIAGTAVFLGGVTALNQPRQFTFGGRWSF
ncbi:MAG: TonB-dependent receptor [Acidobacteria bacterium]|nr:TonB-dependent receptor [Acidobacteriota bacterium]